MVMLTVQPSSGLYNAVQYDGTNGQAIYAALRGTGYSNVAGVLSFRSFIMRAGGLLTAGHLFRMDIGQWIVWVDDVNPYVVGGPLTDAEFDQQYQVAASAAEIAALQAQVSALRVQVDDLQVVSDDLVTDVDALDSDVTDLSAALSALDTALHNSSADWITTGVLAYQRLGGTIAESDVVFYSRNTLVTPGTAMDMWQWRYQGNRAFYINEYACGRARGVDATQTPFRVMSHANRDGTSLPSFQVSLADAVSHLFQVLANGDILGPGGASMLPTAPVGVTFNATGLGNAALITDGSANTGQPYATTSTYYAANNRVFLDGAIANNGAAPITGGTLLFTIAPAHAPNRWVQFDVRTSTTLTARVTIRGATGGVYIDQSLAVGATLSVDGMNFRRTV